jgi:membrane-bound metal-dependent hydrolase YbcI (DUF457 family)
VARSGLSDRFGPGTTLTLALASNLPDIDTAWALWDPWDRFMLRRTHSHALVSLPILAGLLALGLKARYRETPWRILFGLSALGIFLHLFFDWVNAFGVVFLWPLADWRFELASVFIIDVAIWALTLAPIVASPFLGSPERRRRAYRLSLALLGAYLVLCGAGHLRTEAILRDELARENLVAREVKIFPEPLGPFRFRAAALVGEEWRVYLSGWVGGRAELRERYRTDRDLRRVAEIRETAYGRKIEWFMAAPVWTLRADGGVEVFDLRFRPIVVPGPVGFRVEFSPGDARPRVF